MENFLVEDIQVVASPWHVDCWNLVELFYEEIQDLNNSSLFLCSIFLPNLKIFHTFDSYLSSFLNYKNYFHARVLLYFLL